MIAKVLAVLGLVAVASATDLSVGNEGGKLIFEQNITASPAIWRRVQLLTVNVTDSTDELICRVVVIDNRPDKDGEAAVVDGGEGQKNVTLQLKSPTIFRGFDFSVQVFVTVVNVHGRVLNHPVATGTETQNPQVPKDLNGNSNQEQKNDGDIIIEATAPTASSTTQNTNDQTSVPTPVDVVTAEDTQVNENANKTVLPEMDESLTIALNSSSENNSTQKTAEAEAESDDLVNLKDDEENRKVREATEDPIVPALPEELTNDNQTTPNPELCTTTQKVEQETTAPKVTTTTEMADEKERSYPTIIPVYEVTEAVPTTQAIILTTQQVKYTGKGHHHDHHHIHHAVPVFYVH